MPMYRNTSPLGAVDIYLGDTSFRLESGEEFEVTDKQAVQLNAQPDNFEIADADDLADMTVADLKDYAAKHAIDLDGATTKADIIAAIEKD